MDKYTIDLDKLLNDFEYSELTEQNNILSSNCQNSQPYQKNHATQKHSINNVFHSLNEYLNTDIRTDLNTDAPSTSLNNSEDVPVFVKKLSKEDVPSIEQIFNNISKEESCENTRNNNTKDVNINLANEATRDINVNCDVRNDLIDVDDVDAVLIVDEGCVQVGEEKGVVREQGDVVKVKEQEDVREQEVTKEEEVVKIDQDVVIKQDVKEQEVVVNVKDVDTAENVVQDVAQIVKDVVENVVEISAEKSKAPVVTFEDSIELSDTEIENELEQLELEYQTKLLLENNCQTLDETQQFEEEEIATKPENNEEIVTKVEAEIKTIEIETEEIETKAIETEIETKTIETEVPTEEIATGEVTTENIATKVEETQEVEDPKNVFRPNSLELPPDNLTINLIGEPGSTPYNNVYVSVPAPAPPSEKAPKNEMSPTLSESSSTYDQSDSPNTSDSCNDTSLEEAPRNINDDGTDAENANTPPSWLGKTAPFWTPDSDALSCLHCNRKFTVINRRHHCRACGLVLCSKCSNMKSKLAYMDNQEARVCLKCYEILQQQQPVNISSSGSASASGSGSDTSPGNTDRRLNPNNPMEYCSKVPPLQQVSGASSQPPPSVMVPVGVLKRKGSKTRSTKSVMFMDGIRPGCDLTELDTDFNYKQNMNKPPDNNNTSKKLNTRQKNLPKIDADTMSYIPAGDDALPPIVNIMKSDVFYAECSNDISIIEMLKKDLVTFAIQRNFHVQVKIINMDCCINKEVWCFTTDGMISVGQDEIIILLEFIDNERLLPKDIFLHLNNIYNEAVKGTSIIEMGISIHPSSNFLESKNHAGFLYIKPTFQCVQNVLLPKEPYLIGILIHRWETPWAKIFPLRLLLRLGAEYRYYPSPIISTRHRESVYVEIGHTIINLLADFRNFSYTIPSVRGLTIHMEDKNTTVSIPMNRYDQVMKALNNSTEHILAFSANFSPNADSHLVCIQDTHGNNENAYTTHAINIHNKPRKVTGASFIILNGALKSSSGLTAKSSIIEDGLMIHILPEQMQKLRNALKNMKNFKINCGCVNAQSDESISILWTENDVSFNIGVCSPIDGMSLSGVPSIRVHNGRDFVCNSGNKMIRWTEVFIIQSGEELMKTQDPIDISKISENIAKGTSQALVKYLDLLATNSCAKIGIRTNLNIENVSYLAGSNGSKLPPIYMKSLDNELIPVLHKITSNFAEQVTVVLELKFHILNV